MLGTVDAKGVAWLVAHRQGPRPVRRAGEGVSPSANRMDAFLVGRDGHVTRRAGSGHLGTAGAAGAQSIELPEPALG
jgi:hypothetical protein